MNSLVKKSTILAAVVGLSLFSTPLFAGMAMPAQPKNGQQQPALNPEDTKLLEEVEQQINGYVASLPPDEQKKFWADVDELTKVMSTMSEDELVKFMEDVFTEEAAQQKPLAPEVPITAPAKEIKIEEKPVLPVDKQQAALYLIDNLLKHIGNFLRKAQTMVDLPAKVISWTKEGKLKNWPSTLTWDIFKGYVDELNQKLNKLKDRDPKTNKYKYLDDFIKDEALYNNLSKISTSLAKYEPMIEVSSFGIDKMTTQSRESARSVLMSLQEAYSVLGIPAALDKIFEKFEPTAKKLKESEELTQKQALEASKRPGARAPMTVGGTSRDRDTRGGKEYDYKADQGGRYTPNYDYYDKRSDKADDSTDKKKVEGPTSAGGGKDAGKENAKPGDKTPEKPKEEKEQKAIENAVDNLEKALDGFLTIVEGNKNLLEFPEHMRKDGNDDKVDATIHDSFKSAKSAINEAKAQIARIKRRLPSEKVSPAQKKEFITLIKQEYKEQKTWLDRIANGIEDTKKSLDSFGITKAKTTGKDKKYAYFGVGKDELLKEANAIADADKKSERLKEINDINPVNLSELSNSIRELHKMITELQ
jgi:hypothetical protein